MNNGKIKSFTDLNAWKFGHKLVLEIYRITSTFPKEEKYALVDQMKRAAVSVTSNIAEGFSRQSYLEKKPILFDGPRVFNRTAKSVVGSEGCWLFK